MASREFQIPKPLLTWQACDSCILLLQTGQRVCNASPAVAVMFIVSLSAGQDVLHVRSNLTLDTAMAPQARDHCVPQGVACGRADRRRHSGLWPAHA